jgi:hypothetical protein
MPRKPKASPAALPAIPAELLEQFGNVAHYFICKNYDIIKLMLRLKVGSGVAPIVL